MEVASKHYIVLTPSGEFRKVPRAGQPDADIGDEIVLLARRRVNRRTGWTLVSAALALLLLFPLVLVPDAKAGPIVAYVTLDVNPSVEMGIGRREEVKELRGLNAEGEQVVDGLAYKGEKAADVAAEIIARASNNTAYSSGDNRDIVIASVVLDGETKDPDRFEAELESDIRVAVAKRLPEEDQVTMLSAPQEVREEAARQGVSTGKMAVYLLAKSKNPDVKLDSLKTQSIHEWTEPVGGLKSVVPAKPVKQVKPAKPAASSEPSDDKSVKSKNAARDSQGKDVQKSRLKHVEERHKREKEKLKELLAREKGDGKQQTDSDKGKKPGDKGGYAPNGPHNAGSGGKGNGWKGDTVDPTGNKQTGGGKSSTGSGQSDTKASKPGGGGWNGWNNWNGGNFGSGKAGDKKDNGVKNEPNAKNGMSGKNDKNDKSGQSGKDADKNNKSNVNTSGKGNKSGGFGSGNGSRFDSGSKGKREDNGSRGHDMAKKNENKDKRGGKGKDKE